MVGSDGRGARTGRRRLLPRLPELLRQHPSEDRFPFEDRATFRLVIGDKQ